MLLQKTKAPKYIIFILLLGNTPLIKISGTYYVCKVLKIEHVYIFICKHLVEVSRDQRAAAQWFQATYLKKKSRQVPTYLMRQRVLPPYSI